MKEPVYEWAFVMLFGRVRFLPLVGYNLTKRY